MNAALEQILRKVASAERHRGYAMQPPCPREEIESLRRDVKERFGLDLPAAHEEMLAVANGNDFNGERPKRLRGCLWEPINALAVKRLSDGRAHSEREP